jgi:hypothetical protein
LFALIALVAVSMASDPYGGNKGYSPYGHPGSHSYSVKYDNDYKPKGYDSKKPSNGYQSYGYDNKKPNYEYSPPSYGYDKKPSGYEYQPSPYGYDKYDKKPSYDYTPPSLTMHRRRLFRVYGFAFQ